ncbi:MAG: GntR family transcriptional regulator, partial [bacterium]
MIEFFLDRRDPASPYQQLVRQVRQSLLLGTLHIGDQLPTVKEVARKLPLNPNTVLKAYRELELEGLIDTRPGVGTFVAQTLARPSLQQHPQLREKLANWLAEARSA